jgi:dimethylamine--corrinoid protein Co-methyltransferase
MTDEPLFTRSGDGSRIQLTSDQIRGELEDGTRTAAARAKVPVLSVEDLDHLLDICTTRGRFTGVEVGDEVVLTYDGTGGQLIGSRLDDLRTFEQYIGADSVELYHMDYSFKAVKTVLPSEQQGLRNAQCLLTVPLQYGAMPDLGRYSQPDGPVANWSELLPKGEIQAAREAQVQAVELAVRDMVAVADGVWEAGADGIDLDTAGAAGDADFLAALRAVREIRERHPHIGIELGMANEFVLGMHGELEWGGVRLAGLWPREQMKLAAEAGATIFGPAVNVNTSRSLPWNLARALTLVKPCVEAATIPVHMNVGMGVGGVPMAVRPPADAVCRVARACVEVLRIDGL